MEIRRERYKPRGDSPSPLHQRKKIQKLLVTLRGSQQLTWKRGNPITMQDISLNTMIGPQYLKSWREKSTQTLLTKDLKNLGIKTSCQSKSKLNSIETNTLTNNKSRSILFKTLAKMVNLISKTLNSC